MTKWTRQSLMGHGLGQRKITAPFEALAMTSDAGGLLIYKLNAKFGFFEQFAERFDDYRSPVLTDHFLQERFSPRIFGIALGHEEHNCFDPLRHGPRMAG